MDDFLVAVQREVIALGHDVGLRHAEALGRPGIPHLRSITLAPSGQEIGEVILGMFLGGELLPRDGAELLRREERGALVIQAPAIGGHIVEPDMVGAARVRLRKEEDRRGDSGVGLEDASGEGDDGIELLLLDQ